MASSNNDTGYKVAISILAMLTLLFVGLWYNFYSKYQINEQVAASARNAENEAKNQAAALQATNTEALQLLGGSNAWAESREAVLKAMQVQGVNQQKQTVLATLDSIRAALDASIKENATLKADVATTNQRYLELEKVLNERVEGHNQSQKNSEQQLQSQQKRYDEELQEKAQRITTLEDDYRRLQVEKETERENAVKTETRLNGEIATLTRIVESQRQRLEEVLKTSFEVADGEVVRIDANLGLAYINLGSLDNLRPQVTFSIYSKDHHGIGREARDIKANVEVTRILGPHLAEARILTQDRTRPIAEGDPIYSPVWAGGRTEYFAFVGLIDFDRDGTSDRDALHRLLKNAGAEIDVEVGDDGVRTPADAKISSNTKFLVLGEVPDPGQYPSNDVRRERALAIGRERDVLEGEARLAGVRTVKLSDFMAYMGFQNQLRSFRPGESSQFILKGGARDASIRTDDASGQSSKLFERLKKIDESNQSAPR